MNLASTDKCFGCSACAVVCPKSAIQMVPDDEGFLAFNCWVLFSVVCFPLFIEKF